MKTGQLGKGFPVFFVGTQKMSSRDKAYQAYNEGFDLGLRPDPLLTVSEWADRFRMLPKRSSTEPGRWRTNRTPYLKEIMDCLSVLNPTEQVKFMKGTQIGATEAGNNWFGYTAHLCPAPMMMVLPTEEMAKKHSKQKVAPTIDETPVLRDRIKEAKSRDSGNTMLLKEFVGGMLLLAGSNSGASFRNVSIKNLFLDDVDGYPLGVEEEGDPLGLAKNRTDAFGNRKIYIVSTPTNKGSSRIEQEYEDSDQRKFYVPCPHCNEKQVLMWSGIIFEHKNYNLEGDIKYRCISCGALFEEHHKTWMLENGEWIPSNPGHPHRGYHLSSLYSPLGWLSWEKIVREFLKAKKHNDRELFKHWTNTRLAETWEEDGEKVSDNALFNRREDYSKELIPEPVCILTAGADVQGDRIEVTTVGWGQSEESWVIEHKILYGDPSKPDVWKHLDEFLLKNYRHFSGYSWAIKAACIDTGGHHSKEVYDFVRSRQVRNVYAVKGSSQHGVPIASKPSKNIPGIYLYHIGTDTAKDMILGRLKIEEPGAGYMHFCKDLDEEYFKQLTAEKKVTKHRRGFAFTEWVKKEHQRNEALDTFVYAIAALYIVLSRSYPNNTVSQALERLSERYAAEVNQIQHNIPMPQQPQQRHRRMVSKVDIYS